MVAGANESVSLEIVQKTVNSPLLHDVLLTQPKNGRRVLQWTCIFIAILAYFLISSGLVVANVLQSAVDVVTDFLPDAFFFNASPSDPAGSEDVANNGTSTSHELQNYGQSNRRLDTERCCSWSNYSFPFNARLGGFSYVARLTPRKIDSSYARLKLK